MNSIGISAVNERLARGAAGYIACCDSRYMQQVAEVADDIVSRCDTSPIILISGPSGSGKTTTAMTLEHMLDERGHQTHTVSMDNYFIPLSDEQVQAAAEHKLDLESPARVDIPFLNSQLRDIIACRPVELPRFDFGSHDRVSSGITLCRCPGELVIVEGIHALNRSVITVPDEQTCRIYVSVRTRAVTNEGTLVHPERIRLLRRMLRDKMQRGRRIEQTLHMYHSVQQGENRYIMPHKYRAEHHIDTFLPYELGAYKALLPDSTLAELGCDELRDTRRLLLQAVAVDESLIPPSSLIREFIGGSKFDY